MARSCTGASRSDLVSSRHIIELIDNAISAFNSDDSYIYSIVTGRRASGLLVECTRQVEHTGRIFRGPKPRRRRGQRRAYWAGEGLHCCTPASLDARRAAVIGLRWWRLVRGSKRSMKDTRLRGDLLLLLSGC